MNNNSKGLMITSLGAFIMSLESLFIKLSTITPLVFSFYLGLFMFFSMVATLLVKEGKNSIKVASVSFTILLFCATLMGSSNILFIAAIKSTTVANVVIIFGTTALFSALFAYLFYKERVGKNIFYASFFMFIGLFVIFSEKIELSGLKGNIYALICTIFFSIAFVLLTRYKNISRVALTAISGLVLALIAFLLTEDIDINLYNLSLVAGMGLLVTPISRTMISNGTKYINASEVSLLMIIETIMAPVWVWLFLNEIASLNTLIGGAIILVTLIINSIYSIRKNQPL
jgi:drug/metabolite transporter (DMT)-like permease